MVEWLTVVKSSHDYDGNSYTGKTVFYTETIPLMLFFAVSGHTFEPQQLLDYRDMGQVSAC